MPTYAYRCTECGHEFEAVQSFSEDSLTVCPVCSGRLRKVFNAVGVVFKGSGFYRTDSRSKSTASVGAGSSSHHGSGNGSGDAPSNGSTNGSSDTSGGSATTGSATKETNGSSNGSRSSSAPSSTTAGTSTSASSTGSH